MRVDGCRTSQITWRDSNSSTTLVYPSCFPREGIWHLNRHAQRRSVVLPFPFLPLIKERTSFPTKSINCTRSTCVPRAERVLYIKNKRRMIVHALRYPSLRIQRAGFVPSWCSMTKIEAKPSTARVLPAYLQAERVPHIKKKRRRMIVHALRYPSLRTQRAGFAPSWYSATKVEAEQPNNAREAYKSQVKRIPLISMR
jgi:hypothetical protein